MASFTRLGTGRVTSPGGHSICRERHLPAMMRMGGPGARPPEGRPVDCRDIDRLADTVV